jgi:hypothetical protein
VPLYLPVLVTETNMYMKRGKIRSEKLSIQMYLRLSLSKLRLVYVFKTLEIVLYTNPIEIQRDSIAEINGLSQSLANVIV